MMQKLFIVILFVIVEIYPQNYINSLNKIISKIPENTNYGISIYDLDNNKLLFEQNGSKLLIPASTEKIYTTVIALLMLGYDYNLTTKLSCDDVNISDGIINGNLYFKGTGDPKFSVADLSGMIKKLKSQGINKITNDLIIDDSMFDNILLRDHWIEDENSNVPLPPISAVTVESNTTYLSVKGNSKSKLRPLLTLANDNDYFSFTNRATTSGRRTSIKISTNETNQGESISISGTIPINRISQYRITIKNPTKYIAFLIKKLLLENNIEFAGKLLIASSNKYLNELCTHETPLLDLISHINKRSDNFYAEHLFKIIGNIYSGEEGTAFDASQSIFTFLKSVNLYENNMSIVDGSGISRNNNVSTNALAKLLAYIYYTKDEFEPFYNSLGIAGVDGTVRNRMIGTKAENNCRAKTGTLRDVVSLAGYVSTKSNKLLAFSINFNFKKLYHDYYRDMCDNIVDILANID